jgi:hypothetical protein
MVSVIDFDAGVLETNCSSGDCAQNRFGRQSQIAMPPKTIYCTKRAQAMAFAAAKAAS